MTNSSTPSEPSKPDSVEEPHRGYRVRLQYPDLQRYRYGVLEDGEWHTTIRQKASVLPLEEAQKGANHFALASLKDGVATVLLEEVKSFDPDWCCAPAGTIKEMLEYRKMARDEAARRLGLTEPEMRDLLRGEFPIGPELAEKLFLNLGGTPQFWVALETNYREGIRMGLTVFQEDL